LSLSTQKSHRNTAKKIASELRVKFEEQGWI